MERTHQSAAALVGRAAGPLASHLGAFVSSLIDQQYSAKRGLVLADLSELSIERYQHRIRRRHERIYGETRARERNHVTQLLQFLRGRGICPAADIGTTAADVLVAQYRQYLQDQRGLAATTIDRERRAAATGGVHDGAHVVHSGFEARQIAIVHPIAQAGTACVELDQAGEVAKPLEQMVIAGVFPMDVQIG